MISMIIPAYNAGSFIKKTIIEIDDSLNNVSRNYEILVVSGINDDNTVEEIKGLARYNDRIKPILRNFRVGKGMALSLGFLQARGDLQFYTDADLEISPKYIPVMLEELLGYDVVVVSKHHYDSTLQSPLLRKILSRGYNFLVRLILGSKIRGHQGGLKGFRREAITKILPFVKSEWWFWDTEVLLFAQWLGFRVHEIPIQCSYGFEDSTIVLWKNCFRMFKDILVLKKRRLQRRLADG